MTEVTTQVHCYSRTANARHESALRERIVFWRVSKFYPQITGNNACCIRGVDLSRKSSNGNEKQSELLRKGCANVARWKLKIGSIKIRGKWNLKWTQKWKWKITADTQSSLSALWLCWYRKLCKCIKDYFYYLES